MFLIKFYIYELSHSSHAKREMGTCIFLLFFIYLFMRKASITFIVCTHGGEGGREGEAIRRGAFGFWESLSSK